MANLCLICPNSRDSCSTILLFLTYSKILTPYHTITYKFGPKIFRHETGGLAHRWRECPLPCWLRVGLWQVKGSSNNCFWAARWGFLCSGKEDKKSFSWMLKRLLSDAVRNQKESLARQNELLEVPVMSGVTVNAANRFFTWGFRFFLQKRSGILPLRPLGTRASRPHLKLEKFQKIFNSQYSIYNPHGSSLTRRL